MASCYDASLVCFCPLPHHIDANDALNAFLHCLGDGGDAFVVFDRVPTILSLL